MATLKMQVEPTDLAIALEHDNEGVRVVSITSKKHGYSIAHRQPLKAPLLEVEIARALQQIGLEPDAPLPTPANMLEAETEAAKNELVEVRALLHKEQTLSGSLAERVSELEAEKVELTNRVGLVERERTELLGRVTAYDNAAREMSKMQRTGEGSEQPNDDGPKTNPGGRPNPAP